MAGTTQDKLQGLLDGKQYIIDKLNYRANTNYDINSKWADIGNSIEQIPSSFKMYLNAINGVNAFGNAPNITTKQLFSILSYSDTSDLTSTNGMFKNCINIEEVPVLDTNKVVDMSDMFNGCTNLKEIINLDVSSVEYLTNIFLSCEKLTKITFLGSPKASLSNLFRYCSSLKEIKNLDTSNTTNVSNMFASCTSLQTIPTLDTSNVTTFTSMFHYCEALQSVPPLNVSSATSTRGLASMFAYCSSLTSILIYGMRTAFNTVDSILLDEEALVTIGSNCQVITTTKVWSLAEESLLKIENLYVKKTGVELYEGITCDPCVICESTDEGAMLFIDYMSEKGWTLG